MSNKMAAVEDGWEVMIPQGFIYSTDKSVIGDWRNIIIMENKPGNEYDDPFCASISFTSQVNKMDNARAMVETFAGFVMSGTQNVVRNDDMYVSYSFESSDVENGTKIDVFHIIVGYGDAISNFQVWFNGGRKSYDEKKALVEKVATSIRPVVHYNDTGFSNGSNHSRLEHLSFNNGKEVVIDNIFTVPIPDGYQYSTDPSVIENTRKLIVVPESYNIYSDPMGAPYGLTILSQVIDLGNRFSPDMVDFLPVFFTDNVNFFCQGVAVSHFIPEEGMGIFHQIVYGDPDHTWNKELVIIAADTKAYVMTMIYNHTDLDGRATDVIQNLHDVSLEWLDRIAFKKKQSKKRNNIRVSFNTATPDMGLYPHYYHMQNDSKSLGLALPGVQVVTNSGGTEYSLQSLSKMHDDMNSDADSGEDVNTEVIKALERVDELPLGEYDLDNVASQMQGLFRVNKNVYDMRHDREAELDNGYIRRAYMLNALRSFGWTLSSYCKQKKTKPESVSLEVLSKLVDFIKDRNWLNYEDSSYCEGLCAGQDIFTFYLTDKVKEADKKYFLPTEEDLEKAESNPVMSGALPTGIESLESLRKDLEYLYPAVKTIYDDLAKSRDRSVPLEGGLSDIVYTWIAMAKAAKSQFYTNEGPMSYFLSQPYNEEEYRQEEEERLKKEAKKWLDQYGEYIDKNVIIEFTDKKFVFTGLHTYNDIHDEDVIKSVEDKGGVIRSKVSGLTDYLVIYPGGAGSSKIEQAIEQKEKGKNIKVILLDDLLVELGLTEKNDKKSQDNKAAKSKENADKKSLSEANTEPVASEHKKQLDEIRNAINGLDEQAAQYEDESLSGEDREKLNDVKNQINDLHNKFEEGASKFDGYFEQKEERERREKEERERKIAEAKAKGKSDDDEVNMFVILTNEEKMGHKGRKSDEFYKIYDDDFPAYNKKETLALRKKVISEMKNDEYRDKCRASFMSRPLEERFTVSTKNYFNVTDVPDLCMKAEEALDRTKEWYETVELPEVKKLMDDNLADIKKDLDGQIQSIEPGWTEWRNVKKDLKVIIRNKWDSKVELKDSCSLFQYERKFYSLGDPDGMDIVVEVVMCTGGFIQMTATVLNAMPFYWDVSYQDIWKAAIKNEIQDEVGANYSSNYLATDSLAEIKKKYPDAKELKKKAEAAKKTASRKFVKEIQNLYSDAKHFDDSKVTEAGIKKIVDNCFKSPDELLGCGSFILKEIDKAKMVVLYNLIENEADVQKLYKEIPRQLSEDINTVYEKAKIERQEKERKNRIDKTRKAVNSAKESIAKLGDNIKEKTGTLADLNAKLEKKQAELKEEHDDFDSFIEEEKAKWQVKNNELLGEIEDSKLYIEKLQEQISDKKHELSTLSFLQFGRKKELTKIIENLANEVKKEQTNYDQLKSKRNSAEKEYQSKINAPKDMINNMTSCVSGLKEEIDSLTSRIEDDKKSLEEMTAKLPELENELAKANEQ